MKDFLRQLFSGKDNKTPDLGRLLWAVSVLSFIGYAGIHVVHNHTFDPQAYGLGIGAALAGGGIGLGQKAKTEPES